MTEIVRRSLEEQVAASLASCANPRLRQVLGAVVSHLHQAIREVGLTEAEWAEAVRFLTETGQMCVGGRQEFILLSDVLGISMLIDELNHPADDRHLSESTVLGPFYTGEQPILPDGASILKREEPECPALFVAGCVRDRAGRPVSNALVEVWQTAPNGLYDVQDAEQPQGHLRASFRTDKHGRYSFETILPVSYSIPTDGPVGALLGALARSPWRPAHVHFRVSAAGCRTLVTHLFIAGDSHLESDAVFGVKPSLIVTPEADQTGRLAIAADFALA